MKAIADTGFLVAFLNRNDHYHSWAIQIASSVVEPLLTCEAVVAEAAFHISSAPLVIELIKERGIRVYSMHEIDSMGMQAVIDDAIQYLKEERRTDAVHLSLDLDGIDPLYTPGVGTPVPGGISYRESHLAMEMLHDAGIITSAEFVEVNPILDEKNRTADVAVALIGSLLGEKLL